LAYWISSIFILFFLLKKKTYGIKELNWMWFNTTETTVWICEFIRGFILLVV
jgi:hypothetical protein